MEDEINIGESNMQRTCAECSFMIDESIIEKITENFFSEDCPNCGIKLWMPCLSCPSVLTIKTITCEPCEQKRKEAVLAEIERENSIAEKQEKAHQVQKLMSSVQATVFELGQNYAIVTVSIAVIILTGVMHWLFHQIFSYAMIFIVCTVGMFAFGIYWNFSRKRSLQLGKIKDLEDFSYFPLGQKIIMICFFTWPLLMLYNLCSLLINS